MDYGFLSPP